MVNTQSNWCPSVTEILSSHIDKRWYSPGSAEFGSHVHSTCANIMGHRHTATYVPDEDEFAPCIKSFIEWMDITAPTPFVLEEKIINHKLPLCGTPDFIGEIKGRDGYGIIDWKTSISAQKWWPLQLAAYKHLANNYYDIAIEWIATLRIRKKGGRALFNDYTPIYEQSLKEFLRAHSLHMAYYMQQNTN